MKIILILILISVFAVQAEWGEHCERSLELESECGRYCYKVVRPFLDHIKTLQPKDADKDGSQLEKFKEKIEMVENKYDTLEHDLLKKWEQLERKIEMEWQEIKTLQQEASNKYQNILNKLDSIQNTKRTNSPATFVNTFQCRH
ncbi:uncharacterized protein LOC117791649 [Drosophila innubila]|uniref:uncharacterized protein LOC117791649 n=1 Tax=Drosophila innubila TaxID=198719 RepID=UPI00148E06F0|nr:uncharacterized protein LOC117791649 [Drosophila innubila]